MNEEGVCIAVLRIVAGGEGGRGEAKVGSAYAIPEGREGTIASGGVIDRQMVIEALQAKIPANQGDEEVEETPPQPEEVGKKGKGKPGQGKKFKRKKGEDSIKRVLGAKIPEFSPALIEHALSIVGVDPDVRTEDVLKDEALIDKTLEAFKVAQKIIEEVTTSAGQVKGYIVAKQRKPPAVKGEVEAKPKGKKKKELIAFGEIEGLLDEEEAEENASEQKTDDEGYRYDDFHPFLPKQFVDAIGFKVIEIDGYNNAVDSFVCSPSPYIKICNSLVSIVFINRVSKIDYPCARPETCRSEAAYNGTLRT